MLNNNDDDNINHNHNSTFLTNGFTSIPSCVHVISVLRGFQISYYTAHERPTNIQWELAF